MKPKAFISNGQALGPQPAKKALRPAKQLARDGYLKTRPGSI